MKWLTLLFTFLIIDPAWAKLESSPHIFLPAEQKEFFQAYQQAPISWWNFLLFDESQVTPEQACDILNTNIPDDTLYNPCLNIPMASGLIEDLAHQQTFLQAPPRSIKDLKNSLDKTIVTLSLPMSSDTLNLMRQFPLARFDQLASHFQKFFSASESSTEIHVLPFLLNFSPESQQSTDWVNKMTALSSINPGVQWIGPHFGSQINKQQVIQDLQRVALIGSFLILSLILFLLISRRALFLLLVPTLAISIGGAFFVVQWVWGSIHGLTLAFGCGLVGIAMDYAFHGWSGPFDRKTWRTNGISFVTTLLSFSLLLFFSTPLIRQISLFAIVGLSLAFVFCYLISRLGWHKNQTPLHVPLPRLSKKAALTVTGSLSLLSLFCVAFLNLDFSLQRMDLTHNQLRKQINNSGIDQSKNRLGFYLAKDDATLQTLSDWGQKESISVLNPLQFEATSASTGRAQWKSWVCKNQNQLSELAQTAPYGALFSSFFTQIQCQTLSTPNLQAGKAWSLFQVGSSTLSIFKAESDEQVLKILEQFPKTFFLTQLTRDFPKRLRRESLIFLFSCFFITLGFLLLFFKKKSLEVFVPVLGALSGILIVTTVLGRPITFISFVSLIILLGLTLDYGVFCTAYPKTQELKKVFGSIFLSAATSCAGFAPLAFCGHPVLADLGTTILFGLLGALLFSFLIYPALAEARRV